MNAEGTTPRKEEVESRRDDSMDGGGRAMQDAIAEQRSRATQEQLPRARLVRGQHLEQLPR